VIPRRLTEENALHFDRTAPAVLRAALIVPLAVAVLTPAAPVFALTGNSVSLAPKKPGPAVVGANWPQAAGPNGTWAVETRAEVPIHWSVTRGENVVWKTTLPEAGQSGITVWGNRLFLTTMKPLVSETARKEGHDIVGYCLDANSGKILWTVDLAGTADSTYAYGFSDSTTPSPITDGSHVYFYNSSGAIGCYDFSGKPIWQHAWQPTQGRPFNKQFKPILFGDTLLNMEPRDPDDPKREARDPWNYLRGLDKATGKTLWVSDDAMTHYNTPAFGWTAAGDPAVLQGRGGYHGVPEGPTGLTLTSLDPATAGKTLWRYEATGKALFTMHWDKKYAYWFDQDTPNHQVLDATTGKLLRTQSLSGNVDYRHFDPTTGKYILDSGINVTTDGPKLKVFPAWFSNIPVAGYDYFLCFTNPGAHYGPAHCVGRVNIETGKVEYLELPVTVVRAQGAPDKMIWGAPQRTSTVNSRGIDAAGDKRAQSDGWDWTMLPTPTAVNGRIFYTNMLGVTYVIDGRAKVLDEKALLAVNDLGPSGQTWSLNSISYANGHLYHRSMREVVCIGK
jgi:outer membrane protein assembly factor BamB